MKGRPRSTWRDLAREYGVLICGGPSGCRKRWSAATHERGRVDGFGYIHWDGWDRRTYKNHLYFFLKLVALAMNRDFREMPVWRQRRYISTWATNEALKTFHIRIPWEQTARDREWVRAYCQRHGIRIRRHNEDVWWWVQWKPDRARIEPSKEVT